MLIDQAGLKSYRIGQAEVSTKHANSIVAHPGCTATGIMRLIDHVRDTVLKVHGTVLEQEVAIWK
jgi:UDP-N-acetylmuramate dehydrogenase